MTLGFHGNKTVNNDFYQCVARVLPHAAQDWMRENAWTFLSAPPLPDPLPHSKQWRRGGQGVLDGGWFSVADWNFGWLEKCLVEFGRGRRRHRRRCQDAAAMARRRHAPRPGRARARGPGGWPEGRILMSFSLSSTSLSQGTLDIRCPGSKIVKIFTSGFGKATCK